MAVKLYVIVIGPLEDSEVPPSMEIWPRFMEWCFYFSETCQEGVRSWKLEIAPSEEHGKGTAMYVSEGRRFQGSTSACRMLRVDLEVAREEKCGPWTDMNPE